MRTNFALKTVSFLISVSILFILASVVLPQSKKERKQAEQLAQEGNKAFNQKNYQTALDKYSESIGIVPANAAAHFWKGYSHYYLKDMDKAVSELDIAMTQGYKPLDVYRVRSMAKYEKKDYDGALVDFREGLKLDPNNLMFLIGIGDVTLSQGNTAEALAAFQKALVQDPKNAELYYQIAVVKARTGDVAGQTSMAEEAIKRNTRFLGDAYYLAADGYYKQRRYPEAEQAYSNAISRWKANNEKKPELKVAYRTLGDIYRRINRFDDAIKISKQALIDLGNDGDIYTDISWYYSLADRNQDAIEAAKAGITLLPKEHLAYTNLCRAYNDTGQYQLAINACNSALRITPEDGETYFYLARAYDLLGRSKEATGYYEKAVKGLEVFTKDNPDYSDGFYLLGNAYFADNQRDKAIEAYQKCLALSPRFVKARYNLGIIQVLNKNKSAAMEQYNSLMSLDASLAAKLKTEIDKM